MGISLSFVYVAWSIFAKKTVAVTLKLTLKGVGDAREEGRARKDMRQPRKGQSLEELLHRSSSHAHRTMRRLRLSEINDGWGTW
jgi:hypothetical protein